MFDRSLYLENEAGFSHERPLELETGVDEAWLRIGNEDVVNWFVTRPSQARELLEAVREAVEDFLERHGEGPG